MARTDRQTNRLARETSPYLLQHAHNPVDWYPWGPDALAKAKAEDKPIFLSIGYAACHWCHVMERESFEDDATAAQLNGGFVSIKVDREERPDLDAIYMDAVQAMTGQGGWPMTVFLTPDGKPFYGGTYFPDQGRYGMPSFRDVLSGIERVWREQRNEAEVAGERLRKAIDLSARPADEHDGGHEHEHVTEGSSGEGAPPPRRNRRPGCSTPPWSASNAASTPSMVASVVRRSSPNRCRSRRSCASTCEPATRAHWPSPAAHSTGWLTAASTTTSEAGSRGTRPMRSGSSRTSRRCSTTTRNWRGSISTPGS
jgi:hypothetical protein